MIGEERLQETMRSQLQGRGETQLPSNRSSPAPMSYVTSTARSNASVSGQRWSAEAVHSIYTSTRKTGNHVCRNDVCYKGSVDKKGFRRMMFWHRARFVDKKVMLLREEPMGWHCNRDGMGLATYLFTKVHHYLARLHWRHGIPFILK